MEGVEGDSKDYIAWVLVTHAARKNQEGPGEGGLGEELLHCIVWLGKSH